MDKKDADLFTKLCQFVWMFGEAQPLIFNIDSEIYKKQEINFTALKHLDSIGLISFESTSGYRKFGIPKEWVVFYYGLPTNLEFPNEENNEIQTGKVLFTQAGRELISVCGSKRNEEFYQYAVSEIAKQTSYNRVFYLIINVINGVRVHLSSLVF